MHQGYPLSRRFWVLGAAIILLSSCTINVEANPKLQHPPLVERLPAKVGVYYSDALKNHRFYGSWGTVHTVHVFSGRGSITMFDQVFSAMFQNTVAVQGVSPSDIADLDVDAVIAPEIKEFSVSDWSATVTVTTIVRLLSRSGKEIGAWTANGFAEENTPTPTFSFSKFTAYKVENAIRDAVAKFLIAFYQDSAVKRCLERRSEGSTAAEKGRKCFSET